MAARPDAVRAMNLRVGQGLDAHRFRAGTPLILGGITVPHSHGLEAHSDGDCLLHAVTDALLGAVAAGDIGQHFPPWDASIAGIDSRHMLRHAVDVAARGGWRVVNVDATVTAQLPRLAPYVPAMREVLAQTLAVAQTAVSVKATTTEGMGFTGRGEGIAASAVILVTDD